MKFKLLSNGLQPVHSSPTFARRERGVGLIEVLVAVLVLSLGLLGMAGMQARALKSNQSSYARSQAVMFSYYILDAMRADSASAKGLSYNTAVAGICDPSAITGATLVDNNQRDWITNIRAGLGKENTSCGVITCGSTGVCTVKVMWDDSLAGGLGAQTFETTSRL
jgi:type IV pilus assembly protein PilV